MLGGAFIALLSAFAFSMNGVLVRRGVVHATASQGAFVTVLMGVPMFFVAALVAGQLLRIGDLPLEAFAYLTLAGVIHFVVGRYFNYQAIGAIGASRYRADPGAATALQHRVAYLFLGEGVSLGMATGIGLILLAPVIMVERRVPVPATAGAALPDAPQRAPATPQLRQAQGYLYAALSAIAYGTSPILIAPPWKASQVCPYWAASSPTQQPRPSFSPASSSPSQRVFIAALRPATFRVFFTAAVAIFLAQMFRFIALSLASVAVVSTMQRLSSVFTLFLTWLMNRNLEVITWRLILSVLVSVAALSYWLSPAARLGCPNPIT